MARYPYGYHQRTVLRNCGYMARLWAKQVESVKRWLCAQPNQYVI